MIARQSNLGRTSVFNKILISVHFVSYGFGWVLMYHWSASIIKFSSIVQVKSGKSSTLTKYDINCLCKTSWVFVGFWWNKNFCNFIKIVRKFCQCFIATFLPNFSEILGFKTANFCWGVHRLKALLKIWSTVHKIACLVNFTYGKLKID